MAKFELYGLDELMNEFETIDEKASDIFGAMTQAGAKVALNNVKQNAPIPEISSAAKLTKTYRTPSDGGINTGVTIGGYMPFREGRTTFTRKGGNGKTYSTDKGVPIDFVAMVYEYGRSGASFPKKPFLRKAFSDPAIEKAMLEAQAKASGGILKNE